MGSRVHRTEAKISTDKHPEVGDADSNPKIRGIIIPAMPDKNITTNFFRLTDDGGRILGGNVKAEAT